MKEILHTRFHGNLHTWMPFIYNATDFSELPERSVETYDDLLVVVEKAITLFPDDEAIKEFRAWMLGMPTAYPEIDDEKEYKEEYVSYPDEDSPEIQPGLSTVLQKGYYQAYIIAKKLWVLSVHGLLLFCQDRNDLQIATVPLWYPNFEPCRILDSLCWLDSVYTYVYEVVPKVIVTVKGKHPHKKIELVSSAGASPEHLELASKIENLIDVSVNLPHSTSFMVREGGRAFLVNHASNKYINPMHLV